MPFSKSNTFRPAFQNENLLTLPYRTFWRQQHIVRVSDRHVGLLYIIHIYRKVKLAARDTYRTRRKGSVIYEHLPSQLGVRIVNTIVNQMP